MARLAWFVNLAPERLRWRLGRDDAGRLVVAGPHGRLRLKIGGGVWIRKETYE